MRDFENLNRYLNSLVGDIYEQPMDLGHLAMMTEVIENWAGKLESCKSVLDVGCGAEATAQGLFEKFHIKYTGISLGRDAITAREAGKNVINMDFNFLEFEDDKFDLIFARHTLEHSPMPLLTLMEWHRVSKSFLCLVLPTPEGYGQVGKNHYSVLYKDQWKFLLERAGWGLIWEDYTNVTEYRFMSEKRR